MSATADTDYYRILGVARDATVEEIKRAYRGLSRLTHSDASDVPAGLFDVITEARDVLVDPDRRAEYDRALASGAQPRPGVPTSPPSPVRPPSARPSAPRPAPGPLGGVASEPFTDDRPHHVAKQAERGGGLLAQLHGLEWRRALRWVALLGAMAAGLSALRVALVPVPSGMPFAPTVALGPWGGMGGRVAVSVVGAALVAPWAAVWWEVRSQRLWLSAGLAVALAVLAFAEFVCAAAVMCLVAAVAVWALRLGWRAVLWMYGAP